MKPSHVWFLFLACALGWLVLSLLIAPSVSGPDVFIFRDAGWNLAAWGTFQSAAGPYSHDLVPRLYAAYTPIFPLLFAAYATVFPRNPYAGTVFNLILGLLTAAVVLYWVLRQAASRMRDAVAWTIAVLAPVFIIYDRPEDVALILFSAVIALGLKPRPRPVIAGALIALLFMAHPFGAVVASVWTFALLLSCNWRSHQRGWRLAIKQAAIAASTTIVLLGAVAVLYSLIDRHALARFAANAFGAESGVGMTFSMRSFREFLNVPLYTLFASPVWWGLQYIPTLASCAFLVVWSFIHRKEFGYGEWLPIAAGLTGLLLAIVLVPYQHYYVVFIAFCIPLGLLIWNPPAGRLAAPALIMLLLAVLLNLPGLVISVILRVEQIPSYKASRGQPALLQSQLPSRDSVVVLAGSFYDLFKPEFRRMVELDYVNGDVNRFADVAAVINCYDGDHDAPGTAAPFPQQLNASEFHLIQQAPQHLWITIFGHKVMRGQWGYGCDLYARNKEP